MFLVTRVSHRTNHCIAALAFKWGRSRQIQFKTGSTQLQQLRHCNRRPEFRCVFLGGCPVFGGVQGKLKGNNHPIQKMHPHLPFKHHPPKVILNGERSSCRQPPRFGQKTPVNMLLAPPRTPLPLFNDVPFRPKTQQIQYRHDFKGCHSRNQKKG